MSWFESSTPFATSISPPLPPGVSPPFFRFSLFTCLILLPTFLKIVEHLLRKLKHNYRNILTVFHLFSFSNVIWLQKKVEMLFLDRCKPFHDKEKLCNPFSEPKIEKKEKKIIKW